MELGYLRRLGLGTAGRVSFGEWARPADQVDNVHQASRQLARLISALVDACPAAKRRHLLERTANELDDLAQELAFGEDARQLVGGIARELINSGY